MCSRGGNRCYWNEESTRRVGPGGVELRKPERAFLIPESIFVRKKWWLSLSFCFYFCPCPLLPPVQHFKEKRQKAEGLLLSFMELREGNSLWVFSGLLGLGLRPVLAPSQGLPRPHPPGNAADPYPAQSVLPLLFLQTLKGHKLSSSNLATRFFVARNRWLRNWL